MAELTIAPVTRLFRYNGIQLPDPSPDMTPEAVREMYADTHPEIMTATVDGPKFEGNTMCFDFVRAVRDKG
jgi:PRTRC genetic system protein C